MKERIRRAERTLVLVNEWIRGADQKISIFLALQGITLTLLIPNYLKTITARFQTHTISIWSSGFVLLATLCFGLGIVEALIAFFPRVSNKAKSHLYFGGIKNMKLAKYKDDMKHLSNEDYFNELCEQAHMNSGIAGTKYGHFQKAIIFFLIGMGLFIVSYISLKFF
jgi:hypothetical protein